MPLMQLISTRTVAPPIDVCGSLLVIGSHPTCDVCLRHPTVSSRHCCITTDADRPVIRDLSSAYGTYVNGRQIGGVELLSGDLLTIGELEFLVRYPAPPRPEEG